MIDPILQRPLRMRKRLCTTPEFHLFTDVIPSLLASLALLTRLPYFQRDFVPNFEVLHLRAHGYDDARGLMAEGHGLPNDDVAIAVVSVVMQVGAAEAG